MDRISKKTLTVSILIIAAVIIWTGWQLYKWHKTETHRAEMQEMFEQRETAYIKLFPEKFPELCRDLPIKGIITASVSAGKERGYGKYYNYSCRHVVTLKTDAAFDQYSDRKKYETLGKWKSCAWNAYSSFKKLYMQDYSECMHELSSIYDLPMFYGDEFRYLIETPEHTYQYAIYVNDYYLLDGHDHFLRDKQSEWYHPPSTPTPEPARSSSRIPTRKVYNADDDYYDADDYIDADDFASDWEDSGDFEDYDDAYDYYEEVMEHD